MSQGRYVYLDHAASSPATPACLEALAAYAAQDWAGANPNSLHAMGRAAYQALEGARATIARLLGGARPSEVVFTSGGTESNNLAVIGIARAVARASNGTRRRILVSSIEHDSVLDPARHVAALDGLVVELVPVTRQGFLDLEAFSRMLGPDVALVSVMAANNEVATVQPLAEVVDMAHSAGALVHSDAIQAFGHVPFDPVALDLDAASITAHKLGGPVGIGALYLRGRTRLDPQIVGGGQEMGLRSGTQDVRGALAFAAVAQDAFDHLEERSACVSRLAERLVSGCCGGEGAVAQVTVTGMRGRNLLPGIVHLLVPDHQTEGLVLALDQLGFEVSGGSACSSGSLEPSHVLSAMGVARDLAFCALRVSFDHRCAAEDIDAFCAALGQVCASEGMRRRRPARHGR